MVVKNFLIIGGGESGIRAALSLRGEGFEGSVTVVSGERHLPYNRPALSKSMLVGSEPVAPPAIVEQDRLKVAAITLIRENPAAAIDRQEKRVMLMDRTLLAYDKLLLATGAVSRRLPMAPPDALYLRDLDDATAIKARLSPGCKVAIIGAGFIGLELAAAARLRGASVTIIEGQPRVLMRGVPQEVAEIVERRHRAAGVKIHCGEIITGIEADGGEVVVNTAGGLHFSADHVVVGVGAVPETGLAERAGLVVENGIAVDQCLRTSDPDIFAVGDCCSVPSEFHGGRRIRLESWRNARDQGVHAALNMMGGNLPYRAVPWFWSDQYELTLNVVGWPEGHQQLVRRDLGDDAFILFHLGSDGRLVAGSGIGPGNRVAKDIRLTEMLIGKGIVPNPAHLANPDIKLRGLLGA